MQSGKVGSQINIEKAPMISLPQKIKLKMKKYFENMQWFKPVYFTGTMLLLLWLTLGTVLTGCKKSDRLFTHVDSIAAVPSQFHFFNTFSYYVF